MKVHRDGTWLSARGTWVWHQGSWVSLHLKQEWHWPGTGQFIPHVGYALAGYFCFTEYLPNQMRNYTWMSLDFEWPGYHWPCRGYIEDRWFTVTKKLPGAPISPGFVYGKWGHFAEAVEVGPFAEDPLI
jgi:hypothetical protein